MSIDRLVLQNWQRSLQREGGFICSRLPEAVEWIAMIDFDVVNLGREAFPRTGGPSREHETRQ